MKKLLVVAGIALAFAANTAVAQQDQSGGAGASAGTIGGVAVGTIVAAGVGIAVAAAIVSNNRGTTLPERPQPPKTCTGDDPLNADGFCVSTTTTVTVTGTGTSTSTITVPVTSTYAPFVQ